MLILSTYIVAIAKIHNSSKTSLQSLTIVIKVLFKKLKYLYQTVRK